jgi:hypothetical protein
MAPSRRAHAVERFGLYIGQIGEVFPVMYGTPTLCWLVAEVEVGCPACRGVCTWQYVLAADRPLVECAGH